MPVSASIRFIIQCPHKYRSFDMPTFSSNAVYIYNENLPYLKNDSDMYYHFIAIMRFVDGKYCFLWLSRVLAISHKQGDIILLTLCRCRHKSDNVTQDLSLSYIEQQIRLRIKQDQIIQFPQYEIHPLFIHEYVLENEYMSTLI